MRREIVHAVRNIARMPVLATVVIVSIAVGVGVNTAVFSWVQSLVLRPLPGVRDASAFLSVEPRAETGSYPGTWLPSLTVLASFADGAASLRRRCCFLR